MWLRPSPVNTNWNLLLNKKDSPFRNIMPTMVSLLQKPSMTIVTFWMKNILLVVLEPIIRMALLNAIWKQYHNRPEWTCYILLIIGQARLMSAPGYRQLNMPYGFSKWWPMTYCQANLVALQLRNLIVHMCWLSSLSSQCSPSRWVQYTQKGTKSKSLDFSWVLNYAFIPGAPGNECRYRLNLSTVSCHIW